MDGLMDMVTDIAFNWFHHVLIRPVNISYGLDTGFHPPTHSIKNIGILNRARMRLAQRHITYEISPRMFKTRSMGLFKMPFYQFSMDVNGWLKGYCTDVTPIVKVGYVREAWNHPLMLEYRTNALQNGDPYFRGTP